MTTNKQILLLIDGMNFAFRSAFTSQGLKAKGKPIHLVFGFFRNYISLMKKLEKENPMREIKTVICWDSGGYAERMVLSEAGVQAGIIHKTYKQDRRDKKAKMTEDERLEHEDMSRQLDILNEMLQQTSLMQVTVEDEEADDTCASYVKKCKDDYEKLYIVTSDKDYYQLLDENVFIYDAIKKKEHSLETFRETYNIEPYQWVDLGAFVGDTGDTILGCNGLGEKKALPYIQDYKTVDGVYEYFHELTDGLREQYPDAELTEDLSQEVFESYGLELQTPICSGIRIALLDRTLKKLPFPKVVLNAIEQEEKVRLAYQLKKMRCNLDVPEIVEISIDDCILTDLFKEYSFFTLLKDIDYFLDSQFDKGKINKVINVVTGGITDKKMYKCPHCNEEFMSNEELDKCPNCDEDMKEKEMIQPTLF